MSFDNGFGSDDFTFQPTENIDQGGGNWVDMPGTFLTRITEVLPNKKLGGDLEQGTISVKTEVVGAAPNLQSQIGKEANFSARLPRLDDNKPDYHKGKLAKLGIASQQMTAADLTKDTIKLSASDMVGRLLVLTFDKNERGQCWLTFAEIYHPDDPKAAGPHLNPEVINALPADRRIPASEFQKIYARDPHATRPPITDKPAPGLFDDL